MGKKVKEYKSGDFIFAKVKGYPAWPARVQKLNGKKYFVYFYGTGETANLAPNMIFDYAENKDKFLTKTVKRRDFNDGVKQIEHDFANNVPLDQVIGMNAEAPVEPENDSANDSATNETMDDSAIDTTAADDTVADTTANTTQNDTAVEDSDDAGALVIDEGKQQPQKSKKSKAEPPKTPAKETPKPPKTPRGKPKKDEAKEPKENTEEDEKKEDEIVSRSGRKIRPKRYIDEQTEENSTLPAPALKRRRGGSPASDKEKEKTEAPKEKAGDKNMKHFNTVTQSELEDLKEPFKSADADKDNILVAYLPTGQYVGIRLFQTRPSNYKNDAARLQWDKQAASNAVTLKLQLERGHITTQSVLAQLVMDLNLTDEEKAALDKERETEEKKSRVQFLKTEMKLIELDAKIKTCLCLEKADTELCLKLLDELMELDVKPLMLLKHPTCLETVKRMRAYVGNTPSWDLSESAALVFSKQAHRIRKQADTLYKNMKDLFVTPEGLSFWEFFSERVLQFKKATAKLNADELLEMVHEPLEMTVPTSHTNTAAIEAANEEEMPEEDEKEKDDTKKEDTKKEEKKKNPTAKSKKTTNSTTTKPPLKRQSSRKQADKQEEKEKETEKKADESDKPDEQMLEPDVIDNPNKEKEPSHETPADKDVPNAEAVASLLHEAEVENVKETKIAESEKAEEEKEKSDAVNDKEASSDKDVESPKEAEKEDKEEKEKIKEKEKEKEKSDFEEPRAKRSRGESKKTEPPPRSPAAKRKVKN